MKNFISFCLTALAPVSLLAHPSLAPHEHQGFLNGWESYVLIPAAVLLVAFLGRKAVQGFRIRK